MNEVEEKGRFKPYEATHTVTNGPMPDAGALALNACHLVLNYETKVQGGAAFGAWALPDEEWEEALVAARMALAAAEREASAKPPPPVPAPPIVQRTQRSGIAPLILLPGTAELWLARPEKDNPNALQRILRTDESKSSTHIEIDGLEPGAWQIRVRALNGDQYSEWSEDVTVLVP